MRIMLVDEFKIVNYAGGIEHVLCNFANEFVKRNCQVVLVGLDTEKGVPAFDLDSKVKFINLCYDVPRKPYICAAYYWQKAKKEILRAIGGPRLIIHDKKRKDPKKEYFKNEFIRRLNIIVQQEQPDIIIDVGSFIATIVNKVIQEFPSIAHVSMCHTDAYGCTKQMSAEEINAWKKCDAVQVLMPSYVTPVKKLGIHHVVYIPNIVPQIAKENTTNLETCHHTIINVGRVEEVQKRQHLLIKAFAKIAGKYPDWKVKIYGQIDNNGYTKALRKLISLYHLEDRIIFCGTTKEIRKCLAQADIFAFPSAFEGFPLALTEAMAMGIPAIGYRSCSAVNELIQHGENGLLCEEGIDDFATKLELLITNQELRIQMGAKAHEDMKEYAPNRIWDMWEKLICNYANIELK